MKRRAFIALVGAGAAMQAPFNLRAQSPALKTIGMVVVAALAANAVISPPLVTMIATFWRTSSCAMAGRRLY